MWARLLVGLVTLLGIYLLIRTLLQRKTETPNKIDDTFDKVFSNSEYQSSQKNWLLVSKMETANWTSKLFINNLNLWGMGCVAKRPTTQSSCTWSSNSKDLPNRRNTDLVDISRIATETFKPSKWGVYETVEDSVEDIILWMRYTKFPTRQLSIREHIVEMKKRGYFAGEDVEEYLKKVLAWEKK